MRGLNFVMHSTRVLRPPSPPLSKAIQFQFVFIKYKCLHLLLCAVTIIELSHWLIRPVDFTSACPDGKRSAYLFSLFLCFVARINGFGGPDSYPGRADLFVVASRTSCIMFSFIAKLEALCNEDGSRSRSLQISSGSVIALIKCADAQSVRRDLRVVWVRR